MEIRNGRPTFKQEIRDSWRSIKEGAAIGAALSVLYVGATVAVNVVATPILLGFNGLERALGAERTQTPAVLIDRGVYNMPSGSQISWGEFRTDDGSTFKLDDSYDFLAGKFLPNGNIGSADLGGRYLVDSLQGPLSNKVIDLDPIE
jgi:hypothetical protein